MLAHPATVEASNLSRLVDFETGDTTDKNWHVWRWIWIERIEIQFASPFGRIDSPAIVGNHNVETRMGMHRAHDGLGRGMRE